MRTHLIEPLEDRKLFAASSLRVYFIGNSMTDQVRYPAFDELATSRGHDHVWGRHTLLGSAMSTIWRTPGSGFFQSPYGRFTEALQNYTWDAITLNPTDRDIYQADANGDLQHSLNFINLARQKSPNVQTYILQRTPRREINADGSFGSINYDERFDRPYEYGDTYSTFTRDYFNELVATIRRSQPADSKPVKMIPVGDVFFELNKRIEAGQVPGVNDINKLYVDQSHYTNLGAYVTSLTFFATLYGENPTGLGVPSNFGGSSNIPSGLAAALQDAVWDVVTSTPYTGVSRAGDPNHAPFAFAANKNVGAASTRTIGFDAIASTDVDNDPLSYSWNFGDGTTGSGRTVNHTYSSAGNYTATLTVSDGRGGSSTDAIPVSAGNTAPSLLIPTPFIGLKYSMGNTVAFDGSASDAEDGALTGSALKWNVTLYANQREYTILDGFAGSSGSFNINTIPNKDPDRFYRVSLTATDTMGVARSIYNDVRPNIGNITIASNIAGTTYTLDQLKITAGAAATRTTTGTPYTLTAPATQTVGGKTYRFVSWSDGGAASHGILAPFGDKTYTATYALSTGGTTNVTTTIRSTADATVRDGTYATKNYGTLSNLQVKKSGGTNSGFNREVFFKFNLSGLPAGAPSAVKLRVNGKLDVASTTAVSVGLYPVSSTSWSESAITFATRPASGGLLKSFNVSSTGSNWFEMDVTSYVKQQLAAGKTVVGFSLKPLVTSGAIPTFVSREGGNNAPQLVFTTPVAARAAGSTVATGTFLAGPSITDELTAAAESIFSTTVV